ncbi:MAG TPA: hypothetical protein VNX21_00820 [Candidatus Thermoplasmatota archaeon]|nr:hypothetical protein [Candidatus Thermoplasmatota archaeon]
MRAAAIALLALLVAGCVSPTSTQAPGDAPSAAEGAWPLPIPDPMGHDHDHSDPSLHGVAWGFAQVAHHPVAGNAGHSAGAHALAYEAGFLFVAAYGGDADAEGGVFVFDAKDPAAPKLVGRVKLAGALGGDRSLGATDDGEFAVLGTEALTSLGHLSPTPPGIWLIDARDKANPRVAGYANTGTFGAHSITIHRIGGKDYVFVGAASAQNVFEIVRTPLPMLRAVGERPIGHDAVVEDDPLLGAPLLYAANGGAGFEVWDVSDPARPQKVAAWNIPDRGDRYYVHHSAVQFIEGRRIVVVESEDWEDYPSPLWVLDATDFEDIQVLANWSNPGGHAAAALRYSLHNPVFLGDKLVVAHYHGGVWALDLSTAQARADPPVVGVFLPSEPGGKPVKPAGYAIMSARGRSFAVTDTPMTMDVKVVGDLVYAADLHTGIYALRPTW